MGDEEVWTRMASGDESSDEGGGMNEDAWERG